MASSREANKLFLQYSSYPFPTQYSSYCFPSQHSGLKLLVEEIDEEKKERERDIGKWKTEVWLLVVQTWEYVSFFFFLVPIPIHHSNRMGESEACPVLWEHLPCSGLGYEVCAS